LTGPILPRILVEPLSFSLWPNALSLDAPVIAVLWQLLLARSLAVKLNPFEPLALGLAVWLIYVADHLIDTARPASGAWEPPRKLFYRRHWRIVLAFAIAVGLALAACGSRLLWPSTLLGGLQLSCAVAGYFSMIHLTPAGWRILWPREMAVATLFTLGTFGAVWLGNGRNMAPLALPAAIFMLLCLTNCSLIETLEWQAGGSHATDLPNRATRWVAGHTGTVAGAIAFLAVLQRSPFGIAGVLSGGALWLLALNRRAIPIRLVSPAADLALYSPLLLLALKMPA
jgi:hypothetical protein